MKDENIPVAVRITKDAKNSTWIDNDIGGSIEDSGNYSKFEGNKVRLYKKIKEHPIITGVIIGIIILFAENLFF